MSVSLKDINRPALSLVVVANVAVFYAVRFDYNLQELSSALRDYESYVPAAFLALVVGVLNSQLDHNTKARLVFWRWRHPLPGCYAFSEIMSKDDRIDPEALAASHNPLPQDPSEQNRLWFAWYREFQDEPGIKQAHREYLFTRDWTGLSALMFVSLVPLAFWQMDRDQALFVAAIFVVQYLAVRLSAKNHGKRFVASVLAYKSAKK